MTRITSHPVKYGLLFAGLAALGLLAALFLWLALRDPLASLPRPEHGLPSESTSLPQAEPHRRLEHVVLHSWALGDIGFAVSLPDPLPAKKLPVLLVLGGLGTGEDNIRYVTAAGDNAIIGYDWPMPVRFYQGVAFILQMPELYRLLMTVPGQIVSALGWLEQQPWADNSRTSILGFSLGALAAPVAEDLTQQDGQKIGWTIIAYGGAPLGALFADNPHVVKNLWLRTALGPVIDLLLRPLQPALHAPHLNGQFLVLEGRNDALIPAEARDTLREAVPEPKTVVVLAGNHMGVGADKWVLLQKIIDTSRQWLADNGAVNR